MDILIALLCLVFGILSLILFFKLWAMCNNVSRIADKLDEMELNRQPAAYGQAQQQPAQSGSASAERPESDANVTTPPTPVNGMSQEVMQKKLEAKNAAKKIQSGQALDESWVNLLIEYPQPEVIEPLVKLYVDIYYGKSGYYFDTSMRRMIQQVISACPRKEVINCIYKDPELLKSDAIKSLIKDCKLFDPTNVLELCKTDMHCAFGLLEYDAPAYTDEDVSKMKEIVAIADNLPERGKLEQESGKTKYICPDGHKNKDNIEYCKFCGLNTKGLNRNEVKNIELLRDKIEILGNK